MQPSQYVHDPNDEEDDDEQQGLLLQGESMVPLRGGGDEDDGNNNNNNNPINHNNNSRSRSRSRSFEDPIYGAPLVRDDGNIADSDDEEGGGDDDDDDDDVEEDEEEEAEEAFAQMKPSWRKESRAADLLSIRLLSVPEGDEEAHERVLMESLRLLDPMPPTVRGGPMLVAPSPLGLGQPGIQRMSLPGSYGLPNRRSSPSLLSMSTGGVMMRPSSSFGSLSYAGTSPGATGLRPSLSSLSMRQTFSGAHSLSSTKFGQRSRSLGNLQGGLMLMMPPAPPFPRRTSSLGAISLEEEQAMEIEEAEYVSFYHKLLAFRRLCAMAGLAVLVWLVVVAGIYASRKVFGPPYQPVGAYQLIEVQEGSSLFDAYHFYNGPDSAGSAGFNTYVSQSRASQLGIYNVTMEPDTRRKRHLQQYNADSNSENDQPVDGDDQDPPHVPFVYIGSAPTPEGPRESIRLEGTRKYNRGLFIIDLQHMPAGCGVWPAFWMTDEANWPTNGEIDIVEGCNYQPMAKTALHSTKGCSMLDIPLGTMTGGWDTSQGIPDAKTGIPDMTMRYAQDCFVYDSHQWINQGCVAVDLSDKGTLGVPLNEKGGGVFALEWDPTNRHIRSWVFTPHEDVPENLESAIQTASNRDPSQRVMPDPQQWPLPYGYYPIGVGTDCPSSHFKDMRLVINTAFCGSVTGTRYFLDCPVQFQEIPTCNAYIASEPEELREAYWKIRGIYVYEREWLRTWLT